MNNPLLREILGMNRQRKKLVRFVVEVWSGSRAKMFWFD